MRIFCSIKFTIRSILKWAQTSVWCIVALIVLDSILIAAARGRGRGGRGGNVFQRRRWGVTHVWHQTVVFGGAKVSNTRRVTMHLSVKCELWRLRRSTNSIGYILCHVNKRFYIIGSSVFIHVHFKEVDTLYQINDVFLNCNFWKANGLQGWTLQWKSEATVV